MTMSSCVLALPVLFAGNIYFCNLAFSIILQLPSHNIMTLFLKASKKNLQCGPKTLS